MTRRPFAALVAFLALPGAAGATSVVSQGYTIGTAATPVAIAFGLGPDLWRFNLRLGNVSPFSAGVTLWCAWGGATPAANAAGSFPLSYAGNAYSLPVEESYANPSESGPSALSCISDGGSTGTSPALLTVTGW